MCLITFSYQTDAEYPFVLLANRDESFSRPSLPIHEWAAPTSIIGGRDLEKGGAWLAFSKSGKFAALTNYPFTGRQVDAPISRGRLITDYLDSDIGPMDYVDLLQAQKDNYDGFHLLLGYIHPSIELIMYNNIDNHITSYAPGVHAISNTYDDLSAYRKSQSMVEIVKAMQDEIDLNRLITIFQNTDENPHLRSFPNILTLDQAKKASAIFVKSEGDFGTVSTTAIVLNKLGQLSMKEVGYSKNMTNKSNEIKYNFN